MILLPKCHRASVKQAGLSAVKLLKPMPSHGHHMNPRHSFCCTSPAVLLAFCPVFHAWGTKEGQNSERKTKGIPASSVLSLTDGKVKHTFPIADQGALQWELSHCLHVGAAAYSLGFVEARSVTQSTPTFMFLRGRWNWEETSSIFS